MDTNFILFFIFIIIIIEYISYLEDGMMLIVMALFFAAIFVNTLSSTPIFFANSAYEGWGQLFNTFWLILVFVSIVKSIFVAKNHGLLNIQKVK